MRVAGRISEEKHARKIIAYLHNRGIKSQTERDGQEWLIWIEDENKLAECKEILSDFQTNPLDEKYNVSQKVIEKAASTEKTRVKSIRMSDRWDKRQRNTRSIVNSILITLSIVITLLTSFSQNMEGLSLGIYISDKNSYTVHYNYLKEIEQRVIYGLPEVRKGEIWRLITPIFLHLDPMHLAFNMLFMIYLGTLVESLMGSWRYLLFVLGAALFSNLAQYYFNGPGFGGMSGVGYALFGYIWLGSKYFVEIPSLDDTTVMIAFIWLLAGFLGFMNMANVAHAGGFIFGILWILISHRHKRMFKA